MNMKDNIYRWACNCNQNLYFNVSITSRELQTSRLGLVSVSFRSRLEILTNRLGLV